MEDADLRAAWERYRRVRCLLIMLGVWHLPSLWLFQYHPPFVLWGPLAWFVFPPFWWAGPVMRWVYQVAGVLLAPVVPIVVSRFMCRGDARAWAPLAAAGLFVAQVANVASFSYLLESFARNPLG